MFFPWILCGMLCFLVLVLSTKLFILRKSMKSLCMELEEHLSNDTNTLLSISSRDRQFCYFVSQLNQQLRLLRKQRQQYQNGNWALKEAVTNISHDLRTPLTAICGYLELLEGEEKTASTQRYLDIIKNRVETMEQLTDELFRYSVIVVSSNDTHNEKIILNEVLEESILGFYAVLKKRNIEPFIQMPQDKVIRFLPPSQVSRVLSNLLNNAVNYSDGDLTITLSQSGDITFTNHASKLNQVQVGKLFDRFYTVNTAQKSTGLGLGITKTLVEQMKGKISASYQDDQLCICISFPNNDA